MPDGYITWTGLLFVSMLAKTVSIIGTSLLLMGSKIVIYVPEGGTVVSSSGLVTCSARETCTIDTSEFPFTETFTAVAAPGYEFAAWGDGEAAVCVGSHNADCTELDISAFSDFPGEVDHIDSGSTFTMRPIFLSLESTTAAPPDRISVSSVHRTRYFGVSGESPEEVWADLHGARNPLAKNPETGRKPAGNASIELRYEFQTEYVPGSSHCRVASGNIEFMFETTLPRMVVTDETSDSLKRRWQLLEKEVTEHEVEHIAIYQSLISQLPDVMTSEASATCSELNRRVKLAIEKSVDAIRVINVAFDERSFRKVYTASLPSQ
jgi:predicted secreted Zn-dependent protease